MKLAFSLVIQDDAGARRLVESVRAGGFQGIEPTLVPEGTLPAAADPRDSAARLRRLADDAGLTVPSMRGGPGFWSTFASDDPAKRAAAVELAEKALQALKILGGDTWHSSGWECVPGVRSCRARDCPTCGRRPSATSTRCRNCRCWARER